MRIGLLHPGEMGAAFGAVLTSTGHEVFWVSSGRSAATLERARSASLVELGTFAELAAVQADVILSICPPHAAVDVALSQSEFPGIYVDANAVAPATAVTIADTVPRCVDGSIVGAPPSDGRTTHLYLSGSADTATVAELFTGTNVEARVVSDEIGAASALKMAYAAWTKGSAALLLAVREAARVAGVEADLLDEWRRSSPELLDRAAAANRSAIDKGWRWVGEMEEIAEFFEEVGVPDGFHLAAAEIYRQFPRVQALDEPG
jgi:3-hydroxyisobutyrate dehydrogenase-like beta-hydroxyacid dehydrogenase